MPPVNGVAYRVASGRLHGKFGFVNVVTKNTISPATAGNPVTFSSGATRLMLCSVFVYLTLPDAPLSSTLSNLYEWLDGIPAEGNRSLPVPKKMYCCVAPTFTVAIDANSGWAAPAAWRFVDDRMVGSPSTILKSNRHT